jgi:hypothetical protein
METRGGVSLSCRQGSAARQFGRAGTGGDQQAGRRRQATAMWRISRHPHHLERFFHLLGRPEPAELEALAIGPGLPPEHGSGNSAGWTDNPTQRRIWDRRCRSALAAAFLSSSGEPLRGCPCWPCFDSAPVILVPVQIHKVLTAKWIRSAARS